MLKKQYLIILIYLHQEVISVLSKKTKTASLILFTLLFILNFKTILAAATGIITPPPELQVHSITDFQTSLKWTSPRGSWKYNIYRSNSGDSDYTLIGTTFTPTFVSTGLKPSTTYWYYIRAYNSYGAYLDSPHIKVTTSSPKGVLGFTTWYSPGDMSSYNSLVHNSTSIDEIATYTFNTDGYGKITGNVPVDQVNYGNNNNIKTLALVTNNFSGETARALLESPANRQNLINNILSALKDNNYEGVNIDIEGVYYYNREYFTDFMKELYNTLNPQGFEVTVDVPAKTWDNPSNGWSGAFDYSQIAKYADRVIIMTYDEHYSKGPAGPIASIGWVQKVVDYAVTVIPREKIVLGVAAYGYDWSSKGTKAYGIDKIKNLAAAYGAQIQWDSVSKTPFFNYIDGSKVQHTVWFENNESLGYKLDIVNSNNLWGISIWKLGLEDTDYWTTIKAKLKK